MHRAIGWVLTASILLGVHVREANGDNPDRAVEARRHFDNGTRMYAKGQLSEALIEFEKANELKPDAALLYDLAETHRALGHDSSALAFYRAFLEAAPYSPKREEVDGKIRLLGDQLVRRDSERKQFEADAAAHAREAEEAKRVAQQFSAIAALQTLRAEEAQKAAREAQQRADKVMALHQAPPIYKRWWLWTVVGAVATGIVVTTVVLATPSVPATNQGHFAF
jgi:tetratricopeptide (TPR) repeat protein